MSQANTQIEYTTETVREFMEASIKLSGNFQAYVTGMIETNHAQILIDYVNEIFEEYDSPEFNKRMSKLRKQISRACESLGMDIYTIKKVDGAFQFVLAKKQATIDPEAQPENDAVNPDSDGDSLHSEASRLMATFMANRTVENAAKVTEFMAGLIG